MASILSGIILSGAAARSSAGTEKVDFNFEIRPLLSDRCFKCHGPDEKSRKAHLRLDIQESAYQSLGNGVWAIKPGDPDASEVVRRIFASDPDDLMPPPDSHLSLNATERELLRRWIAEGAEYQSHWAFLPITSPALPQVSNANWIANAIDTFVLARLESQGLQPSRPASRETMIRRLSFDLTGLPPTVEEIDGFLADASEMAYETLVDRLLSSSAYGERMANDWLDLARYADTYGYQSDVDRDMSPWRDWVIEAFNENLPYDRFIVWQLAGDLLPQATREQRLATAFNRLHRQTNEGGSIEEEFRMEYASDRVHTMGTAFLGLTLECARCHDHKYDPITQKNYYELLAFFNNINESGLYSHFTRAVPSPTMLLYQEGQDERHQDLRRKMAQAEKSLAMIRAQALLRFEVWRQDNPPSMTVAKPVAQFSFDGIDQNQATNSISPDHPMSLHDGPAQVQGLSGQALQFSGDNSAVVKDVGAFGRTNPFSFSLWIQITHPQSRSVILHRSRAWTDSGSRGYEFLLEENRPSFNLVHFWPGNALGVRARNPLPTNQWVHVAIAYDGSSRAQGLEIFANGQPMELETIQDSLTKDIHHRREWGDSDVGNIHLTLAGRFRDSGFKDGMIDELQVFDRRLTRWEILQLGRDSMPLKPAAPTDDDIFDWYLARVDEPYGVALQKLERLRQAENDLVNDIREIMVMEEMPIRRPTYILRRGSYMIPGESVNPDTPAGILPFSDSLPRNRLGLAQWMIDRRNPLTVRVAVNRVWKLHFGRGLVETLEDFGSQGQLPSHPKLLDWLAAWFMDNDWDLKRLHKLIVTSSTYRQSSQGNPNLAAMDPNNRWLARGPKHRLKAEIIRDSALAVSGLLVRTVGGPSVYPYQPAGLWKESGTGKTYHPSKGEGLHRRSLYTFWRRTAPPPSMLTFDATSREVCTARREVTATPLQSLVLLNDPQFVEAARALAERVSQTQPDDVDGRLVLVWRTLIGREPDARERSILGQAFEEQREYFNRAPEEAKRYLSVGEYSVDETHDPIDLAALAVVVNMLMNYDEFVVKR